MTPVGLTSVKPALACARRWITNSVAVNGRTLSQSAQAAYPCGLLLARSVAGTPDSSQSLFPERLQWPPAYAGGAGNLAAIRNVSSYACAGEGRFPVTVLIPTACRIFRTALWASSRTKLDFRPTSRFQIDELAGFRRFAPTGKSGEAFPHARPAGCFRYRRLASPKFLAPSAQPFEPGPGAFPLASGVRWLFAP